MSAMLKRDWTGRYVRLQREMVTVGGVLFKAGEVMWVRKNFGGLFLEATYVCPHCNRGYRVEINQVAERDVVLLDTTYVPAPPIDYAEQLTAAQSEIERLGTRSVVETAGAA